MAERDKIDTLVHIHTFLAWYRLFNNNKKNKQSVGVKLFG